MNHSKLAITLLVSIACIATGAYWLTRMNSAGVPNASNENLDPQVAQFLEELAKKDGPPIYTLQPKDARKVLDDLQAPIVNTMPAEIQDTTVPGGPLGPVSVRIVRPAKSTGILPAVVYIHGGGWILGDKDTHDLLIRRLANWANVAVVFVNYTPSPEAHYPTAIEESYAVAKYVAQHGNLLKLDGKKLAIAGDSVGGLMTAAVVQLAQQRGEPKIAYQVLLYPVTDAQFDTASYQKFGDGYYWLSKKAMQWFWDSFAPDKAERANPAVSPLRSTIAALKGQPPALIIVDENDVLRDEGEAYAHKLMQAGVNVTAVRVLGTVHDFGILAPLKDTAPTLVATELAAAKLAQALHAK